LGSSHGFLVNLSIGFTESGFDFFSDRVSSNFDHSRCFFGTFFVGFPGGSRTWVAGIEFQLHTT